MIFLNSLTFKVSPSPIEKNVKRCDYRRWKGISSNYFKNKNKIYKAISFLKYLCFIKESILQSHSWKEFKSVVRRKAVQVRTLLKFCFFFLWDKIGFCLTNILQNLIYNNRCLFEPQWFSAYIFDYLSNTKFDRRIHADEIYFEVKMSITIEKYRDHFI